MCPLFPETAFKRQSASTKKLRLPAYRPTVLSFHTCTDNSSQAAAKGPATYRFAPTNLQKLISSSSSQDSIKMFEGASAMSCFVKSLVCPETAFKQGAQGHQQLDDEWPESIFHHVGSQSVSYLLSVQCEVFKSSELR